LWVCSSRKGGFQDLYHLLDENIREDGFNSGFAAYLLTPAAHI
jgi:hypothetical protein